MRPKAQTRSYSVKFHSAFITPYVQCMILTSVRLISLSKLYIPFTGVLNLRSTRSQPGIEAEILELKWQKHTPLFSQTMG